MSRLVRFREHNSGQQRCHSTILLQKNDSLGREMDDGRTDRMGNPNYYIRLLQCMLAA